MSQRDVEGCVIEACFAGDTERVRALVAESPAAARARFEALDGTALHVAAHRGFAEIVELLLANGAEANAREGCSGASPLHWAAEGGHPRVVELLLDAGAALDARDFWHDETPLGWALYVVQSPHLHDDRAAAAARLEARGAVPSIFARIACGRVDGLRELVARDRSQLEVRSGPLAGGVTPLLFAAQRGLTETAELLLELGADAGALDRHGLGALAAARLTANARLEAALEARGAPAELSYLVVAGRYDEARAMLGGDASALRLDGAYERLAPLFALYGAREPLAFLLEAGAAPDASLLGLDLDEWLDEWPALFQAAKRGHEACARVLLEHRADPRRRAARSGLTALHVAAASGAEGVARLLLGAGADANAASDRGSTPLHHAASRGDLALVRLLLGAGADRTRRDGQFHATPAGWAQHAGSAEVVALLGGSSAD